MMIYKGYILLCLLLSVWSIPTVAQHADEALLRDSVYRHVIQSGRDSLNCYLAYRPGSYEVVRGFDNNDSELSSLDAFIRRSLSDTLIYVRSVRLTGYCSIEGPYKANEELAVNRVRGMKRYIDSRYNLSSRYPVVSDYVAEDWETLRGLIAASSYPWRKEVVSVIDRVGIFEGRESLLMKLDGGTPYREMQDAFFSRLRRVEITVEYDLRRIIEERYQRKMSDTEFETVLAGERERAVAAEQRLRELEDSLSAERAAQAEALREEERLREARREEQARAAVRRNRQQEKREQLRSSRREFRPLIGIKTNLLGWAGVTPELERMTFMPNLAGELFFGTRWSAELSGTYANFAFGRKEHWGVTGYSLEPRFWLRGNHRYTGLFVGVYGQVGDFNVRRPEANYTGTYLQGGISLGYYLLLSKRWGVEAAVRGGYHKADVTLYEAVNEGFYDLNMELDANRMGLTGIHVNVSYRF